MHLLQIRLLLAGFDRFFILNLIQRRNFNKIKHKLDVDPRRDDDASPMSTYR